MSSIKNIGKLELAAEIFGNVEGVNHAQAKLYVNAFFELLKKHLINKKRIQLIRYGTLRPTLKKGGRTVLNLRTKEELPMPDVASVKLGSSYSDSHKFNGKVTTSQLADDLSQAVPNLTAKDARQVVSIIIANMRMTVEGDDYKMEIRDFGTFKSAFREQSERRNPKTGEVVTVEARWIPKFKISKILRSQLTEAYLNGC